MRARIAEGHQSRCAIGIGRFVPWELVDTDQTTHLIHGNTYVAGSVI